MNPSDSNKTILPRACVEKIGSALIVLCFAAGCQSVEEAASPSPPPAPPPAQVLASPPSAPVWDGSWPVSDYVKMGAPDPARFWTPNDYGQLRDVLYQLSRTQRNALPRMDSSKSGLLFARLINATNTLLLAETSLPTRKRIELFMGVLNRFPVFQGIYRADMEGPAFHREAIELDHAYLSMLRHAVEWNGKKLRGAADESSAVTFRLVELARTGYDSLLGRPGTETFIAPSDSSSVVGARTAATVMERLPWLADGTGVSDVDRHRAVHSLQENLPGLWSHITSAHRKELASSLDEVLRRTQEPAIRKELESLRQQLILR